MAQFPNLNRELTYRGKTHTSLVVSEGAAPAEELIVSRTNNQLEEHKPWIYEYGPEGNQTVVLPKGKIVEVVGNEYDNDTGFHKTAVKFATNASEKVLGVNFHNVYSRRRDGMHSHLTRPVVITRNYIELPLFEVEGGALSDAQTLANAMKYGAVVSAKGTANELKHGDHVVSDAYGNVRKYVKGTDAPEAIFGQVWTKEDSLPPAGFLQYYTDMINPQMEEYLKMISRMPSPGAPADGKSADAFPYGAPYTNRGWKPEFERLLMGAKMAGIPFLTDGFFRAQEVVDVPLSAGADGAKVLDANIEAVRVGEGTSFDVLNNRVTVNANTRTGTLFIKMKHPMDKTQLANVSVSINGVAVNANDFVIDIVNNIIVVYLPENETNAPVVHNTVRVHVPSVVDPVAGIPTGWDFKGSTGAVRILLQK